MHAQVEELQASIAAQQEGLTAAHDALFSATEQLQLEMKAAESARQQESEGRSSSGQHTSTSSQAAHSSRDLPRQHASGTLSASLGAAEAAVRRAAEQMQVQTLHHKDMMGQAADNAGRELQALAGIHQAHCATLDQLHAEQVPPAP